ncbi:MAG: NAD(P)H-dependent oxidoreductase subunit E [Magnetospirillum sp.]|jgi:formate dehydrogenase beta subunit|nr:NAD(P)H-dependent oxidoreductase subunit E [Magnetospirillum sp.]
MPSQTGGDRKNGRKGRALDEAALAELRTLLGTVPRTRDRLIENLHLIQDRFGHLAARHLNALAHEMRLSEAEVYEVASFYHHFDIVKEGEAPPPARTLRICNSLSCAMMGAEALLHAMRAAADPAKVRVVGAPCIGRCAAAPAAMLGQYAIESATQDRLAEAIALDNAHAAIPFHIAFDAYRAQGGYRLLERLRAAPDARLATFAALDASGLRGLGGAGFPVARKWKSVHAQPAPRLMTVNADEGEPGTFKDRHYLESDPHRTLEGILIAAWAVEAERVYIYLRDEYPAVRAILGDGIAALERAGLVAPGHVELRRGAGAYICGEESAMIESIEGKRGLPRHRPPYIAERGLFGRPTLNHNVETLHWLREILEDGPEKFANAGRRGYKGRRTFSVSGRVASPGVKIAPAGITARELIEEFCGGMAPGHELLGYLPGGASGGILPARLADLPLDFGTLDPQGAFVGSHAVIVLSQADDPRAVAGNLIRFFRDESCGQCTPCRAGTEKMASLLAADDWSADTLGDLEAVMRDASICGLGQAAPNPVRSVLRFFADGKSQ